MTEPPARRNSATQSPGNRLLAGTAVCLAISTMLLIGACDNGGSSTPGGVVTPTPSPSPSPSASPTPAPVATSFPLGAETEFYAMAAVRRVSIDESAYRLAFVEPRLDRVRVVPVYLGTERFVIREGSEEAEFSAADMVLPRSPEASRYGYRKPSASESSVNGLDALNNTNANFAVSDPNRRLRWTSYAAWYRDSSVGTRKNVTYAVFGFPTTGDRLPQADTIQYRAFGFGINRFEGPGDMQSNDLIVNISINRSKKRINLYYRQSNGSSLIYGLGAIIPGTNRFSGHLDGGMFHGEFFGPDAEEIGIVIASDNTVGVLLGIRN